MRGGSFRMRMDAILVQPNPTAEKAKNRVSPAKRMLKMVAIMVVKVGLAESVHQFRPIAGIFTVRCANPGAGGHELEAEHDERCDKSDDGEDFQQAFVFFAVIFVIVHGHCGDAGG